MAFQSEQIWVRSDLAIVRKDGEASLPPPSLNGTGLYLFIRTRWVHGGKEKDTRGTVRMVRWKALSDALPVSELVIARGMKCDERCRVAGREGESINHVLFQCDIARQNWALSYIPMPPKGWLERSIYDNISYMLSMSKNVKIEGRMEMEEAVCPFEACPPFIAPPKDWVRCEIGMEWSRGSSYTVLEAKLQVYMWVVESMRCLRYQKVIFSSTFDDLSETVVKPWLWPALQFEASELRKELQSVVNFGLTQSYVASGHPQWLDKFSTLGGG
ncbi:uncharacterized protein LOC117132705 [Brassica rapa]|uniref:uncharacterized protein LOC117132705 n=1 Tax=Brassica campestris TaxID=3711 RepID=UPI00142E6B79|nr:uncharacterized protein LOC117132705 [Brassica rapa]